MHIRMRLVVTFDRFRRANYSMIFVCAATLWPRNGREEVLGKVLF